MTKVAQRERDVTVQLKLKYNFRCCVSSTHVAHFGFAHLHVCSLLCCCNHNEFIPFNPNRAPMLCLQYGTHLITSQGPMIFFVSKLNLTQLFKCIFFMSTCCHTNCRDARQP